MLNVPKDGLPQIAVKLSWHLSKQTQSFWQFWPTLDNRLSQNPIWKLALKTLRKGNWLCRLKRREGDSKSRGFGLVSNCNTDIFVDIFSICAQPFLSHNFLGQTELPRTNNKCHRKSVGKRQSLNFDWYNLKNSN